MFSKPSLFLCAGSHQRMPRPIWICMHRYNFDHNSGGSQLNIFVCRHIEKSCCSALSLTVTPLLKSSRRNKNQITTFLTFVSHTRTHAHIEIKTDMHITTTLRLSPTKIFDAGFFVAVEIKISTYTCVAIKRIWLTTLISSKELGVTNIYIFVCVTWFYSFHFVAAFFEFIFFFSV